MTVASVLLVLSLAAVEPQTLQTPDQNRIEAAVIDNNRRIPSDTMKYNLEKKVGISQESPYDPARVKKAEGVIKLMLAEKGRQDATVETVTELIPPTAIALTFKINEGPKIKIQKIDFQGNTVFSDRKIKRS